MNNLKLLPALLVFAEVAKRQSFTEAAKSLGMSKSALSQQLKKLEENIGQQLLSRNTRGMSLTEAGARLLKRSELLQGQVDLALQEISNNKETPSGRFAITIPHAFERDIAIPALSQLCLEFPLLEPDVWVSDDSKDLIADNLDIAIYGGDLKDSNYRAIPIGSAREIICATPTSLTKQKPIVDIQDLSTHKWIPAPWQTNSMKLYKGELMSEETILDAVLRARSNTLPGTLELVSHHMGLALLPEFVLQDSLSKGELAHILPAYQGRLWPFYLVHRFQREKPIHVTRFYQLIKHFFNRAIEP
jgi:DNA-binding transcriptional LysR family regulator